jgi:squalene-hopene/tetraprenyl-beta-curcumene cyclase
MSCVEINKLRRAIFAACLFASAAGGCSRSAIDASKSEYKESPSEFSEYKQTISSDSWNQRAAATYLDQRDGWWMTWETAARDHQTFCVSCHTVVPYALARQALRGTLGEKGPSPNELRLIENVRKRVRLWRETEPFYTDRSGRKASESRGTEAVLNALILASYKAQDGQMSRDIQTAFGNMWAQQRTAGSSKGAWAWLQFGLKPWEAQDSEYYGATLAAVSIGIARRDYDLGSQVENNLNLLRAYLRRQYSSQSLANRVALLWASAKLPGLLDDQERDALVHEIVSKQQPDGGWNLPLVARTWRDWGPSALFGRWKRGDGTLQDLKSDGYATGLIVYALQEVGVAPENAQLRLGRAWLVRNQDKIQGLWASDSLNRRRSPTSNTGLFMSDAATAFAVLALSETKPTDPAVALQPTAVQ